MNCDVASGYAKEALVWHALDLLIEPRWLDHYEDLTAIVRVGRCVRLSARRTELGYRIRLIDDENRTVSTEIGAVTVGRRYRTRVFPASKLGWPG